MFSPPFLIETILVLSLLIKLQDIFHFPKIQIADMIRHILNGYKKAIPTVIEIPSKDKPQFSKPPIIYSYDASRDMVISRVSKMLGAEDL